MILVAGGTGRLGTRVVGHLIAAGHRVRVLTRDPRRAPEGPAEVVAGDVREPATLRPAMAGVTTVVSAVQGFGGVDAGGTGAVDDAGNAHLIAAAARAGVTDFVLLSVHGAAPRHPMPLFRAKYRAERVLMASPLRWTVVRPTAFMETWVELLRPAGSTAIRVFGRGENPVNFVSVRDVAAVVAAAATDPTLRGQALDLGGPQDLTFNEFARLLREAGGSGTVSHVPRPLMRVLATLLRPVRPVLADQIAAGLVMDTVDMSHDSAAAWDRWPELGRTTLREVVA